MKFTVRICLGKMCNALLYQTFFQFDCYTYALFVRRNNRFDSSGIVHVKIKFITFFLQIYVLPERIKISNKEWKNSYGHLAII